jgi:hypothetical protein
METMLTLILAATLNSQPVASATWTLTVALETQHASQVERHAKAERLGSWLDGLDGERIRAAAAYSPFADDAADASPFAE